MRRNLTAKIDANTIKTIEACLMANTLDEVLEALLEGFLQLDSVRETEIMLANSKGNMVPIASGRNIKMNGKVRPEVIIESWLLDSPVKHSVRKVKMPVMGTLYSIPLLVSGNLLGFLKIQLDKTTLSSPDRLGKYYLIALQLSAKIKEMMLAEEVKRLRDETEILASNYRESLQRSTGLSKELYSICAISTKINQSLDIDDSLNKSMVKIKEVFNAQNVAVYTKDPRSAKLEFSSMKCHYSVDNDGMYDFAIRSAEHVRGLPYGLGEGMNISPLTKPEADFVQKVIIAGKPLIKEKEMVNTGDSKGDDGVRDNLHTVGVPLKTKGEVCGVMVLVRQGRAPFSQDNIRLLCGIADIMAMAIENMHLYWKGEEAKNEATFLAKSVEEFNKKLDLKETLKSVAKKGVEFIGQQCLIYLPGQSQAPLVYAKRFSKNEKTFLRSKVYKTIKPGELAQLLVAAAQRRRPTLVRDIGRMKRLPGSMVSWLTDRNFRSLLIVPLRVKRKQVGLLILGNSRESKAFDQHDLSVAEALGGAATVAIENARTYSDSLELSDFLEKKIANKIKEIDRIVERQKVREENRTDIIFRVNRKNRFVFANKAMEVVSGVTREELYRGEILAEEVVAEEDRDRVREYFRKILNGGLPLIRDLVYRHLNRKGEDRLISLTVYPEINTTGRIVGLEGSGRDITEKKRLEAELAKAKDLAMLGEFSGAIAHQLRNPLSNILMGAKLLQSAMGLDYDTLEKQSEDGRASPLLEQNPENLSKIFWDLSEGISDLNQVVTELLEYTKTLRLHFSSQRGHVILREILDKYREVMKKNHIVVKEKYSPSKPALYVDAILISQALQNVIHNAIQAMPEGGTLGLFVGLSKEKPDYAKIVISDTGVGMKGSEFNKIFRPFYTTKAFGTGLGLSLAHRIIEAHGGSIWVAPNKPKGTNVHILLPNDGETAKHAPRMK